MDAPVSPLAQVLFLFTGTNPTAATALTDPAEDARTAEGATPPQPSPRTARPSPSAAGPARRQGRSAA
ncbi:hypothetical protein [Streptomyces cellulosae]|uniref:Uncharacterized protein n=1 Tax=Streptomyces cellulosae TaxID=1968 RepID=A0ABW7YET8_STRCE